LDLVALVSEAFLRRFGLNSRDRLTEIAEEFGIDILYRPAESYDGALLRIRDSQRGCIVINSRIREESRKRFTLAHEIGHFVLSEAVIPLLAQFYEQNSNVARRGLIASPHRKLVVQAMEKELVDPRHSVDFNFPAELAFIAAEVQRPELFRAGDEAWWSPEWEQASKRRNEVFLQFLAESSFFRFTPRSPKSSPWTTDGQDD
jgi:IrrE N-terminal-like domain